MPRKSRIDTPGALHHIMARGIERRPIFRDDQDRDDFLKRLAIVIEETVKFLGEVYHIIRWQKGSEEGNGAI